jgi:O-antigen/teichoic acid export membrane protein
MFHNTTGSVGMFMQMTGLHREYRNVILFTLALHVALCLLVVPSHGMLGAAIVYGLTRGLKNLLSAWIAYRKTGINSLYIPFIST